MNKFLKLNLGLLGICVLIVLIAWLFAGCGETRYESVSYDKVVPDSMKEVVSQKLVELMTAAQTQNRAENEDWDNFVRMAKYTLTEIYGETTVGIWLASSQEFIPFDKCSPAQQKMIQEYLNKER